ncbi:MAG: ABC transporter ATP-binding protein [Rhizobiaceae bacterium]|nr:ABC transporter ATP-binding protein [Rhizobiaceae bacterium]
MAGNLRVQDLAKVYQTAAGATTVVNDVSFDVGPGEFFTMLGPSGCGKTTTLRMIAGLETVSRGRVIVDGTDTTSTPARLRNIGMVFQSYALFPHLSVEENVAYGLRIRKLPEVEIKARVRESLDLLALTQLAGRLPGQLSGGQQQRVSIARALVYRPPVLLLDEPLANLDAKLRVQMRDEIRRVQRSLGITVLYVTHDQEEAMAVSDRIAVFDQGRVAQIGQPTEIYDRPNSLFVAGFIGKANFLPVAMIGDRVLRLGDKTEIAAERICLGPPNEIRGASASDRLLLMIRPESIVPDEDGPLNGRVDRIEHLGPWSRAYVILDGYETELMVDQPRGAQRKLKENDTCQFGFSAADATVFRGEP